MSFNIINSKKIKSNIDNLVCLCSLIELLLNTDLREFNLGKIGHIFNLHIQNRNNQKKTPYLWHHIFFLKQTKQSTLYGALRYLYSANVDNQKKETLNHINANMYLTNLLRIFHCDFRGILQSLLIYSHIKIDFNTDVIAFLCLTNIYIQFHKIDILHFIYFEWNMVAPFTVEIRTRK